MTPSEYLLYLTAYDTASVFETGRTQAQDCQFLNRKEKFI